MVVYLHSHNANTVCICASLHLNKIAHQSHPSLAPSPSPLTLTLSIPLLSSLPSPSPLTHFHFHSPYPSLPYICVPFARPQTKTSSEYALERKSSYIKRIGTMVYYVQCHNEILLTSSFASTLYITCIYIEPYQCIPYA